MTYSWVDVLQLQAGDVVALVGAGEKHAVIQAIERECAQKQWRLVILTTVPLSLTELALFSSSSPLPTADQIPARNTLYYQSIETDRVTGLTSAHVDQVIAQQRWDVLVIVADTARGLPLKAPRDYEPVIPLATTLVIPVASLNALKKPLSDDQIYNAERIASLTRTPLNTRLKTRAMARVIASPQMGLKAVPATARVIPILHDVPVWGSRLARARVLAKQILNAPRINSVILAHFDSEKIPNAILEVQSRVGAVIVAAGKATRMGDAKVLLPWVDERPILQHIIRRLQSGCVSPVVVVTGEWRKEVSEAAQEGGARVTHNPDYAQGEMLSSLQAGIRELQQLPACDAMLLVLGDQPSLRTSLVRRMLALFAQQRPRLIIPSFEMRRGHPILIRRDIWDEFLNIPQGGTPRSVIQKYSAEIVYLNVWDDAILRDIDTPEDYRSEIERAFFLKNN